MVFFASFWWSWDLLLENLKWKDKLQIWGFGSLIFWSKFCFCFLGLFKGVLASVILKFPWSANHGGQHFYSALGWLAMHGWSTIPEFYYLVWLFNLKLKLCLYCKEITPFLLFFCFWSSLLAFLLLIPFNFINNYFCPKQ